MTAGPRRAKMQVMSHDDPDQAAARRYVSEILRVTGWSATALARKAHLSPSTLTRFLNDDDVTHTLSARTIRRIKMAAAAEIPIDQLDTLWLIAQRVPGSGGGAGSNANH